MEYTTIDTVCLRIDGNGKRSAKRSRHLHGTIEAAGLQFTHRIAPVRYPAIRITEWRHATLDSLSRQRLR